MTRSILRVVLTTLALALLFAGSLNLNRTSANAGGSTCADVAGCPGGPILCGAVHLPDGTTVECGMR